MSKSSWIPEELIKTKAQEIWKARQREGRDGTADDDWEEAVNYLEKEGVSYLKSNQTVSFELKSIQAQIQIRQLLWNIPKFIIWTLPKSEWMKLLAAPLVLSAAGALITSKLQEESQKTNTLNNYFDEIETLVFERELLDPQKDSPARLIAKSRSSAILRDLDVKRQELVISFLEASNLINRSNDNDGINLSHLNLKNINLYGLNLEGAELTRTNLERANLRRVSLNNANLTFANLINAYLINAEIYNANLASARLTDANLESAHLKYAYLTDANLINANLKGADLRSAYLTDADLINANLEDANLINATFTMAQIKSTCNWQKAIYKADEKENKDYINKLKIDKLLDPKEPPNCSRWGR